MLAAFLSGIAALIYQTLWIDVLAGIVGSTTRSLAWVVCTFLVSLTAGAAAIGRTALVARRPLHVFAALELSLGVLALGSLLALRSADALALAVPPAVLVAVAVVPAALLMGGTFPAMAEAARAHAGAVPRLYGFNTAGAAAGALLPALLLLPVLGTRRTALVALAANLAAAAAAALAARPSLRTAPSPDERERGEGSALPTGVAPALAMLSGASVLSLEIAWERIGRFAVGNRALAVSAVLAVVLAMLALASLSVPRLAAAARRGGLDESAALGSVLLGASAVLLATAWAGTRLALSPPPSDVRALVHFAACAGPAFFAVGLVFPWLLASRPATGRAVGSLYAVNGLGTLAGTAGATFVLLPLVGTAGVLQACAVALLVPAAALALASRRRNVLWGGAAALAVAALFLRPIPLTSPQRGFTLLDSAEDEHGAHRIQRDGSGFLHASTDNVRLSGPYGAPNTTYVQMLQADLPLLLADDPRKVLNLGTGYGITAGAFTRWDVPTSIETVEIVPFLAARMDRFERENGAFLADPRVRLSVGDGRRVLLRSGPWDVISVNPANPALPGSSRLATVDFFRMARVRLAPGGVYVQQVAGDFVDTLLPGLLAVFPRVLAFRGYEGGFVVVARADGEDPGGFHVERITPRVRDAWRRFGVEDLEAQLAVMRELADDDTRALPREVPVLHTDDLPVLRFGAQASNGLLRTGDDRW